MQRVRRLHQAAAVVMLVCLAGLSPAAAEAVPRFEPVDCPAEAYLGDAFRCGYLIVPADRSQPDSLTLRLMVAVHPARSTTTPPDPIIYLSGGPGGASVMGAVGTMRAFVNFSGRDIVFFDQRGTGFSEPNMVCPETQAVFDTGGSDGLDPDETARLSRQALHACHDRLIESGIDLTLYNSAASAADVNDLRLALGYEQVNLLGISYGTRLALTVMRDYPEGIRSAILDSVYPPNVDGTVEFVPNQQAIFAKVFAACAADADCNEKYPDLETVFYALVETWNDHPVTIKSPPRTLVVDGFLLIEALFSALYDASIVRDVPRLIYEFHAGDTAELSTLTADILRGGGFSQGMFYSVQCHEEVPFSDKSVLDKPREGLNPLMQELTRTTYKSDLETCAMWGAGIADAVESQPVASAIPALLLAGEFDPITPPEYAELAASTLSRSHVYIVPRTAHGVLLSGTAFCSVLITLDFLDEPATTPGQVCPNRMPFVFR